MKKGFRLLTAITMIAVFAVSCNFPLFNPPQDPGEISPNLTLTALFDTSMNIPPTVTPAMPTAPQENAPTALPPTGAPGETATSVPATDVPVNTATSAPTQLPTNTAISATSTPEVRQRAGTLMKAAYLVDAPVMDGTYAEWVDKTNKYAIPYVVWQKANWKDAADLEGVFATAWDEDYLYVSVKVTDDVFVQNKSGEMIYLGDSVEILIDANLDGDFYTTSLSPDDYQLGISPGNPDKGIEKEAYLWYPVDKKGSKAKVLVSSQFETSPIYRVEVGIPWTMLGITPAKGLHIGFAVSVSDNDKPGENLQQTMISTTATRDFLDPTTWGELVLVK